MSDDRFFRPRRARTDLGRLDLTALSGFDPLLFNSAEDLSVISVAVFLLKQIQKGGGAYDSNLDVVFDRVKAALPESAIALVEEEVRSIGIWFDDAEFDDAKNPDVSNVRSVGSQRWRTIVSYAIESGFDLRGEYYEPESDTWPVVFGSPLFFDESSVVLERRDGVFVTVLFRDTRWLMPVTARSKPELADVIPFRNEEE